MKRAVSFDTYFCDDPKCGLHITSYDGDGRPICETIMSRDITLQVIEACKKMLYEKAVSRDDI